MSAAQAADESSYPDLVAGAIAAVRRLLPSLSAGYGVAHWNDAAGRTQQEVIDKLDEVINSLPEEASENTAVRA
jgi:hypothetical protein